MRGSLGTAVRPPAWTLYTVVLVGTAFAAEPNVAVAPPDMRASDADLIVNRADDSSNPPAGLTLRMAIEQAVRDPRDNVIRFDASVFAANKPTIRLGKPIVLDPHAVRPDHDAGHDTIDVDGRNIAVTANAASADVLIVRNATLTVRGLKLSGGAKHAMLLSDARVTLENCQVADSAGAGITLVEHAHLEITGGRLAGNKSHGIELHDTASFNAFGVELRSNGQAGLAVFDRAQATLEDCAIESNGQWGVVTTSDGRVRTSRCRVIGSGFANVDAAERSHIDIEACRLSGVARFGILANGNAHVAVLRSAIAGHEWHGVELQGDARADLRGSSIEGSGHFGAVLFGRSRARIDGGSISHNRGHGLAIRDNAAADISDCTFEQNECSGVGAPDAADGGRLSVRRCIFHKNGMRPIFRGPMHIDPAVPTVAQITGDLVTVRAAPHATIDLYADRAGEASRYLRTVTADDNGRFTITISSVPSGEVITAAATTADGHTSEFNVIAAQMDRRILAALLARTGPLSDAGDALDANAGIQRWRPGTRVLFQFADRPPPHVETYVRGFVGQLHEWLGDTIRVEVRFAQAGPAPPDAVIVAIRYGSADEDWLKGTGGTTFTQWDSFGYFTGPIRIFLARPAPGEHACPRVAIHEMCHALGLYHARVGLLSRMQGIPAPAPDEINDFSPAPTFFDVAALRILYAKPFAGPTSIAQLTAAGLLPPEAKPPAVRVAANQSPPAPAQPTPTGTTRR